MSTAQAMRIKELTEAAEKHEAEVAEKDARISELETQAAEFDAEREQWTAEKEAAKASFDEQVAKVEAVERERDEAIEAKAAAETERDEAKVELEAAKTKLASPAYADAGAAGGVPAEGDTDQDVEPEKHLDTYEAMPESGEKHEYWLAHSKEIIAEAQARIRTSNDPSVSEWKQALDGVPQDA